MLAVAGLPAGDGMDGRVLREAFAVPPPEATASYAGLRGGSGAALGNDEEAQLASGSRVLDICRNLARRETRFKRDAMKKKLARRD